MGIVVGLISGLFGCFGCIAGFSQVSHRKSMKELQTNPNRTDGLITGSRVEVTHRHNDNGGTSRSYSYYISYQFIMIPTTVGAMKANQEEQKVACRGCNDAVASKPNNYIANQANFVTIYDEEVGRSVYMRYIREKKIRDDVNSGTPQIPDGGLTPLLEILYLKDDPLNFEPVEVSDDIKNDWVFFIVAILFLAVGIVVPYIAVGTDGIWISVGFIGLAVVLRIVMSFTGGCKVSTAKHVTITAADDPVGGMDQFINNLEQLGCGKWKDDFANMDLNYEEVLKKAKENAGRAGAVIGAGGAVGGGIVSTHTTPATMVVVNGTQPVQTVPSHSGSIAMQGNVIQGNVIQGNMVQGNVVQGNVSNVPVVQGNVMSANMVQGNVVQMMPVSTVQTGQIQTVVPMQGVIQGPVIQGNMIQGNMIQSNAIQTNTIQSNAIQSNVIQSNGIQSNRIQSNAIATNTVATNNVNNNGMDEELPAYSA